MNFRKIIKLDAINSLLIKDYDHNETIEHLNILETAETLEIVINRAKEVFEEKTIERINKLGIDIEIDNIYQKLDLEFKLDYQKELFTTEINKELNAINVNSHYNKKSYILFLMWLQCNRVANGIMDIVSMKKMVYILQY